MLRALIVSEDLAALEGVRSALVARGFDVLSAQNGADGVEFAGRHDIDGIIVDLDIGEGRGLEICHRISQQNAGLERNAPVWMMTSPRGAETRRLAEVCGTAAVWRKPVDGIKLARRFEKHLRRDQVASATLVPASTPSH